MRKITLLSIALVVFAGKCFAQVGIELDGGLQGMQYTLSGGERKLLPGGSLGLTYTFSLNDQWGLRTGILGSMYRTQATLKDGTFTYGKVDDAGSAFNYNVTVEGYKETQQFYAATVPLLLHYHTDGAGMQWYFDGGGKLVFPFNTSIQASANQLNLSGYYPNFHIMVSNLPQHGFGTMKGWHGTASTALKPAGALSAGTGVSFAVSDQMRVYLGLYADYGLTDLKEKHDSLPLVSYSPSGIGKVQASGVLNMSNSGAATLLSFGVQVRLSFESAKHAGHHTHVEAPVKDSQVTMTITQKTVSPSGQATVSSSKTVSPPPQTAIVAPVVPVHPTPVIPAAVIPAPVVAKKDSLPPKLDSAAAVMDSLTQDSLKQAHEAEVARRNETEKAHRNVVFGTLGETSIPESQKAKLDDWVTLLKEHPSVRISIEGHFCDNLKVMENSKTAEARAKAVARYFEHKGISPHRMEVGYARKGDPVSSTDPAAGNQNRRVVIETIGSF